MTEAEKRQDVIDGLRALADHVDWNPDTPIPTVILRCVARTPDEYARVVESVGAAHDRMLSSPEFKLATRCFSRTVEYGVQVCVPPAELRAA